MTPMQVAKALNTDGGNISRYLLALNKMGVLEKVKCPTCGISKMYKITDKSQKQNKRK